MLLLLLLIVVGDTFASTYQALLVDAFVKHRLVGKLAHPMQL
jgi:hypothetical protein